jgi:hypothetical protein
MDILIERATETEVRRWGSDPGRITIPNTNDVIFVKGVARPIDIGPDHFLATAIVVKPALGADQKRGVETVGVVGQVVTVTMPEVDMTAQEIAARDKESDEVVLRTVGLKVSHVLVELISGLITNGTISATDFTPETRQMYQDVKTITDRLKA